MNDRQIIENIKRYNDGMWAEANERALNICKEEGTTDVNRMSRKNALEYTRLVAIAKEMDYISNMIARMNI